MAKEKHLSIVEVGAVVELAKGLTSSHLIQPMRMMLILILIFFVKILYGKIFFTANLLLLTKVGSRWSQKHTIKVWSKSGQ